MKLDLRDLFTAAMALGTFFCQQHGKQDEFERQMAQQALQAQQEQAKLEFNTKVELLKGQCPPLQQLGPNPSELVLKVYQDNCRPMNDFLETPKPVEPEP